MRDSKITIETAIIDAIASGYETVDQIAPLVGIPFARCAFHLWRLRTGGLVKFIGKRRSGRRGRPFYIYSLIQGVSMPRKVLPTRRRCEHLSMAYGRGKYTVSIGRYTDGIPAEVFVSSTRPSSEIANIARDASILMSIALQYSVPLRVMRNAITRLSDNNAASIIGAVLDLIAPPDDGVSGAKIDPVLLPRYLDATTYVKPSAREAL